MGKQGTERLLLAQGHSVNRSRTQDLNPSRSDMRTHTCNYIVLFPSMSLFKVLINYANKSG